MAKITVGKKEYEILEGNYDVATYSLDRWEDYREHFKERDIKENARILDNIVLNCVLIALPNVFKDIEEVKRGITKEEVNSMMKQIGFIFFGVPEFDKQVEDFSEKEAKKGSKEIAIEKKQKTDRGEPTV